MGRRKKRRNERGGTLPINQVTLPTWEPGFVSDAVSYTRRRALERVAGVLFLVGIPFIFEGFASPSSGDATNPYLALLLYFGCLTVLVAARSGLHAIERKRQILLGPLVEDIATLGLWAVIGCWWYFVHGAGSFVAVLSWWACAILILPFRYLLRRIKLKGAKVRNASFRLWKRKKGETARLLELPEDSAYGNYVAMTLAGSKPDIFVGKKLHDALSETELRAVIAHEFGHSAATDTAGFQLAVMFWRMFALPMVASLTILVPVAWTPWLNLDSPWRFISLSALGFLLTRWGLSALQRPVEMGADRFALNIMRGAQHLVDAFEKMARISRYNVFPNVLDTLGLSSHPCIAKRMEALKDASEGRREASKLGEWLAKIRGEEVSAE
ncbi:M48 family metallopeptidase [Myxococcota bacterium]